MDLKKCIYCKGGNYQIYTSPNDDNGINKAHDLGLITPAQNNWTILICENCGNMQFFREDLINSF